jgi:hypothetical protein
VAGDAALPLLLPLGGRGLAVSATGISGRSVVDGIALMPETVVPAATRGSLEWPEAARADHYRVETSGVRITALDRGPRRFLVEAPVGARVRQTIVDAHGYLYETHLETTTAVALGRTALLTVVIPEGARATFALEGR